jgi:predicted phosphoribosyltransferase
MMRFRDRNHAAEELTKALAEYRDRPLVVYALPRGGVVLGKIIAADLRAPLDLLIPRKIGYPSNPEYAIAAVTETGDVVENKEEVAHIDAAWFNQEVEHQRQEARRRRERYLADRPPPDARGKTAIIVDDGIATGLTMKAAITDLKNRKPASIVIAVPVAPQETVHELEKMVDRVVALEQSLFFLGAIGAYYDTFEQVSDEEVIALLSQDHL